MKIKTKLRENKKVINIESRFLSFEELLTSHEINNLFRKLGYNSSNQSSLREYLTKHGIYQIFSKEFVDSLANDLREIHYKKRKKPILEICAGSGKLSYHLSKRRIPLIATDNGESKIPNPKGIVKKMDHKSALEKYEPEIVLASWLPYSMNPEDPKIELDVYNFPSVKNLVIIGDKKGGCTGIESRTFREPTTKEKTAFLRKGKPLNLHIIKQITIYDIAEKYEELNSSKQANPWNFEGHEFIVQNFIKE